MSEEWDDEDGPRPLLWPLIATAIAALLLVVLAFAVPRGLDIGHNEGSIVGALIAGGICAIILWGIAFAIIIRRAAGGWQVASLLFTLAIGVGAQILAISLAAHRISGDMAAVAAQYRALNSGGEAGPDHVPEGVGPVSRISAVFLNGILQDRHGFDRETRASGALQILSHEGLSRTSPVLRRCADLAALAARARTIGGSGWEVHFAEAQRVGQEAVRANEMTAGDANAFFAAAADNHDTYLHQWQLNAEMIEDAQELCELLAARPWTMRGAEVVFSSQGDVEQAQFHAERIRQNAAEQRIVADAGRRHLDETAGRLEQ